jgi:hypothetical protein
MEYSFEKGELTLGDTIYTQFESISADQPTEESGVPGAHATPRGRTPGRMDLGSLTITWNDLGAMSDFIRELASMGPYRDIEFGVSYVASAPGRDPITWEFELCRVLSNPLEAASGENITSSMECSFVSHTINGHPPHAD